MRKVCGIDAESGCVAATAAPAARLVPAIKAGEGGADPGIEMEPVAASAMAFVRLTSVFKRRSVGADSGI